MQAFPSQRVQSFVNRPLAGVQKPLEYESSNQIQLPPALTAAVTADHRLTVTCVAAGSRCGLWPADSVCCGDCGLAGLSRWRHQGVVGWHFCLADRSHTVPRNPSPRRNGILPWRGAARLFKRAHPTRVNKSHHWLRACVSERVTTGFESQRVIIERVCS